MDNAKDYSSDIFIHGVLIFIALLFLPIGILIDIIVLGPLVLIYKLCKNNSDRLLYSVATLFLYYSAYEYFSLSMESPFLEFKHVFLAFLNTSLSPHVSDGLMRFIFRTQSKAFDWLPISAMVVPTFLIYRYKLWDRLDVKNWWQSHRFSPSHFLKLKKANTNPLIGIDKNSKKPVCLSEQERVRHTQVIGATGFGKSESVLMPMLENDIRNGRGLLLIDAKGDEHLLRCIHNLATNYGRAGDIKIFTPSTPEISNTYSPFMWSTPTQVMNKLIGALEWSEPYYKKMSEMAVLNVAKALFATLHSTNLIAIYQALKKPHSLLDERFEHEDMKPAFQEFCTQHKGIKEDLTGLIADLGHVCDSVFGGLLQHQENSILLNADYHDRKIIVFQLNTLEFSQTSKIIGKIILQDIMQLCAYILKNTSPHARPLFPIYLDDFASFAIPEFAEFLSMTRASGLGVTILHQSLGDLEVISPAFKKQIMSNTNTKIILKVNDSDTIEEAARMTGTKEKTISTYQVNQGPFNMTQKTGLGSESMGNEFNIHPRIFRKLQIGDAVVIVNSSNRLNTVQLNQIDMPDLHGALTDIFCQRNRYKKIESNQTNRTPELKLSEKLLG
ncbi:MAG: type IV secretory pathway VirD4 component-like protein [uncultured bacterium]|nr:MAG: type IV secretory pathway VirD4 component-like protein [uncultured bacterium]